MAFDDDGLVVWVGEVDAKPRVQTLVELGGGSNAYRTHWVDVPVSAGSTLALSIESGRGGETPEQGGGSLTVLWGEPALQGPSGELSLLDLPWSVATPEGVLRHDVLRHDVLRHGVLRQDALGHGAGAEGDEGVFLGGRPLDRAISMKTGATLRFSVPPGYDRLVAECGLGGPAFPRSEECCARCIIVRETPGTPRADQTEEASPSEGASEPRK